ncbi:MAG: hypothetical protein Q8865_04025 [Bacillota bacterium]|nr:hypothetical protein [Bacillota bacterium]
MANKTGEGDIKEVFTKEQILSSKRYENRRDILSALLEDRPYSFDEADETIDRFLKGKVK